MNTLINRFVHDEAGATAIEYALMASMFALVAIVAARNLGDNMSTMFNSISTAVESANS